MGSADTTSPPTRSATASAMAVLPDAVGPKIAMTTRRRLAAPLGRGNRGARLPANLGVLREERVGGKRAVLFRMCGAVLLEPGDRARNALLERHARLVAEQLPRLREVGDVVRHLAEQRRRQCDLRLDVELRRDQLRRVRERVALAVRQVDRLVHDAAVGQRLDTARDPVDAIVDVGEVERLLRPEDSDRLVAQHRVDEERQNAHHACEVVVVAPVDVREAENEITQPIAARVRVDQRLPSDLRRRVRRLGVGEVGTRLARLALLEAVHVAVDLAAGREDDRQPLLTAVLEDVERHHGVLERTMRLAHELVHLRVGGEVHDEVDLRILDAADSVRERRIVAGEILQQVAELVRPGVQALVDAEHLVPVALEARRKVRPDLAARAGDEDAHQAATGTACAPRSVVEVAWSIRTSTSSPGAAVPAKLTVVFRRVRPRSSAGSVRLVPSTSTSSTPPTRSALRAAATSCTTAIRRSIRSRLTSSPSWSGMAAASVPARGE